MTKAPMPEVGRVFDAKPESDDVEIRKHRSEHSCHEQTSWNGAVSQTDTDGQRYRHVR